MKSIPIYFFCEDIRFTPPNKKILKQWIAETAQKEGFAISNVNYIFCSDEYLRLINKKYLNHDNFTDIITFDNNDSHVGNFVNADIYISYERIKENTKLFGVTIANELHRVMVHGILHLCGYKDKKATDKTLMRKMEDKYVAALFKKYKI